MVEIGGGIYLTQNFDLAVNETGDIRTISGPDELEKDLALFSSIELDSVLGERRTPKTTAKIKARVKEIANSDPRVLGVRELTISYPDTERNTAEVSMLLSTVDGQQELVFPVET